MTNLSDAQLPPPATPFTVASLAAHWDCSTTFVYGQITSGDLSAWKLGGKLFRITPQSVADYEGRHSVAAA